MGVDISQIASVATGINRQIHEIQRNLTVYYMAHHTGQRGETIAMEEHDIARHPAGQTAISILRRKVDSDDTQFLGLASSTRKIYLGLSTHSEMIGLITINADRYESLTEARTHMYHLAWHALDLAELRDKPEFREKYGNGPMVPKRSPLNLAKANLRADVFSAIMLALQGDTGALTALAEARGLNALICDARYRAEDYPYVIAMEAAQFAYSEATKSLVPKTRMVKLARRIADEVGQTFDDASIRQWWAFSGPAQNMAWRGHAKEQILGAAINTSEDPYVRSIGMLVSEITGLTALSSAELHGVYNAYADDEINARAHRETVDEIFEETMAQVIFENSCQPFFSVANEQNQALSDGRLLGWCAAALQAAAKAFENALANGKSPSQAARLEFEGTRNVASWSSLCEVGANVIERKRLGQAVTMSDVMQFCRQTQDMEPIAASLEMTASDPAIQARLEAVNALTVKPAPALARSFGPKMGAHSPAQPAWSPPPAAPVFGMGGQSSQPVRRHITGARQTNHALQTSEDEEI